VQMVKIEVRNLLMFYRLAGKFREFVEFDQAKPTLRDLVVKLEELHGKQITDALIDPNKGDIRYVPDLKSGKKAVRILVNGRMAWWLKGLNTELKNGDVVQLFG